MNAKEIWDVETKRDYRKFFTLPHTAYWMTGILEPKGDDLLLEPSAGEGALCRAVKKASPITSITAVESDKQWESSLLMYANFVFIQDFLEFQSKEKFTKCIANPPFGNGIDLQAHFDKMCSLVHYGGTLVILLPENFKIKFIHEVYPLENWGKNSDGTITPIKVVKFRR